MQIDTVIFDMDGVICHTNPWHSKAFEVFFERRGLNPTEEEYQQHMYGKNNGYIFSHFLGRKIKGEELLQYEEEKEGLFREIYADNVEPITGFMDFVQHLHQNNYKLGVATSAPRANMDLILSTLGIESLFGSRLGSEDVTAHKPDPQVYLKSAVNLQSDPKSCLVFEDSFSGSRAGLRAGMKVIGVLSSHTPKQLPGLAHYIDQYDQSLMEHL